VTAWRQLPLPAVASPALLDISPEPAVPPEPPLVADPALPLLEPAVPEPAEPPVPPVLVSGSLRVLQLIWFGAAAGAQRGSVYVPSMRQQRSTGLLCRLPHGVQDKPESQS